MGIHTRIITLNENGCSGKSMTKPRTQTLVKISMIMLHRQLTWSFIIISVACNALLLSSLAKSLFAGMNVFIGIVTFNYLVTGFLFANIFWEGKNEKTCYFLFPTDLKRIIFAKNLSIFILVLGLYCLTALVAAARHESNVLDFLDALVLLLTSIFLFFWLGNFIAVRFSLQDSTDNLIISLLLQFGMMMFASLPYLILKVIFQSYLLCVIFLMGSVVAWYFVMIPSTAKALQKHKFVILGDPS